MKSENVNPGVKAMAQKLQELVWNKEMLLNQGPKSIRTARTNLGSTEAFFDQVLEFALQQGLVHKASDDNLTIYPPSDETAAHMGFVHP